MFPGGQIKHRFLRHTLDLHNVGQLVYFIFSWEKWIPRVELCYDAAETPHVYCHRVRDAKDNLGRTVEARLDVGVYPVANKARRAIVYHFYTTLILSLKKDILWLQITMDYFMIFLIFKCLQYLYRKLFDQALTDTLKIIIFDKLV